MQLSEHFSSEEFGTDNVNPELLQKMEALRAEAGPITITSGYRNPAHNAAVGGASDSQHMILPLPACDCYWEGFDPEEGKKWAMKIGFTGIGIYTAHLHVDVRPLPEAMWDSRPNP